MYDVNYTMAAILGYENATRHSDEIIKCPTRHFLDPSISSVVTEVNKILNSKIKFPGL